MRKTKYFLSVTLVLALVLTMLAPAWAASLFKTIEVEAGDITIAINGSVIHPVDANGNALEPFIYEDSTYLPLRAIGEALGKNIGYSHVDGTYRIYVGGDADLPVSYAGQYLEEVLNIDTADFFTALYAVIKATGGNTDDVGAWENGALTVRRAVAAAFYNSGLRELALVTEASDDTLLALNLDSENEFSGYLAMAVETDFVNGEWIQLIAEDAELTADLANTLVLRVADILGLTRGYLGNVSDADIYQKLNYAFNSTPYVDNDELEAVGEAVLYADGVTGYNVRYSGYTANFLPEASILYGHSNIAHARQLVALMKTLDIDARVMFEPKTTAYEFDLAWSGGEVLDFLVPMGGDRYATYDVEYDLRFEFLDPADKIAFNNAILDYAQRTTDDEGNELQRIKGSWWAPLYASTVPVEGYIEVVCHTVDIGNDYFLTSYGLVEDAEAAAAAFEAEGATVVTTPLYVNVAFFEYMGGVIEDADADADIDAELEPVESPEPDAE